MSHELIFNERNITDEEIVNAAEMNQELSFHAPPPSAEQEEEIEDDEWEHPEDEPSEQHTMKTRPWAIPKHREEFKKNFSPAAEASFQIANFDTLIAM